MRLRPYLDTWRASVWLASPAEGEADRYLELSAEGKVTEKPATVQGRRNARKRTGNPRGRPRELPEGLERRPQLFFTPSDEDRAEIERLAEAHGESLSGVVAQLVAKALRNTKAS
jgi:hypothetical protein